MGLRLNLVPGIKFWLKMSLELTAQTACSRRGNSCSWGLTKAEARLGLGLELNYMDLAGLRMGLWLNWGRTWTVKME